MLHGRRSPPTTTNIRTSWRTTFTTCCLKGGRTNSRLLGSRPMSPRCLWCITRTCLWRWASVCRLRSRRSSHSTTGSGTQMWPLEGTRDGSSWSQWPLRVWHLHLVSHLLSSRSRTSSEQPLPLQLSYSLGGYTHVCNKCVSLECFVWCFGWLMLLIVWCEL
jgi:hypothetical protein